MEKLAFVFPGQGSHYIGMGKSLFDQFTIARRTFEEANDILGFDLAGLCFEGSLSDLSKMENMFPALLTTSVVSFRVYMQELGITPQFCAGHSLGEYSALTCAGVIKYSDALRIVRQRGMFAKEVADKKTGAMTILYDIDGNVVEEQCKKVSDAENSVFISCYNSQEQVAISGHDAAVQKVEDGVLDMGGKITPIFGFAPFHSPLMQEAADKLKYELEKYTFSDSRYAVISNVSGRLYSDYEKETVVGLLASQIVRPVQWCETMRYMQRYGITIAVEMGPKNVLSNLVAANVQNIEAVCFGQNEDRKALLEYPLLDELKKHVPSVVTMCLTAAVATPNQNWDDDEYKKGVVEPYKKIKGIQEDLDREKCHPSKEQMREALEMLQIIFKTKKIPHEEQKDWFNKILEETATCYLFEDISL